MIRDRSLGVAEFGVMSLEKITRPLARQLAKSQDKPVTAAVFVAVDSDKLTLSSFAARAAQRNERVKERFSQIMNAIQSWERESGQTATVTFRPEDDAVVVFAPASLFEQLAESDAVAAIDVEKK